MYISKDCIYHKEIVCLITYRPYVSIHNLNVCSFCLFIRTCYDSLCFAVERASRHLGTWLGLVGGSLEKNTSALGTPGQTVSRVETQTLVASQRKRPQDANDSSLVECPLEALSSPAPHTRPGP